MKIGILGDTHGNGNWTVFALWCFYKAGITKVIQVGDFGIYKQSAKFLKRVNATAELTGIEVYVVPGNHENWDYIAERLALGVNDEGWGNLRTGNLFLAPRVHSWEWDGVKFGSLSGAPSVDRAWRTADQRQLPNPNRVPGYYDLLWYPEEMPTWEHVEEFSKLGHLDVMVAHDAPNGVQTIDNRIAHNPHGFTVADILYAEDGRNRMTHAWKAATPDTFIHGHYHFAVNETIRLPSVDGQEPGWSTIVGLACDGANYSFGHFDTETGETFLWDNLKDRAKYREQTGQVAGFVAER